uniref:Uncharacterized protein n=1 Tax=Amorphochlora amoebiformis TaxID=1561963 RepID=A0A0H5BKG6_9EUKA|nr:hypothetical protein [Amorphochlora amoebiformis]
MTNIIQSSHCYQNTYFRNLLANVTFSLKPLMGILKAKILFLTAIALKVMYLLTKHNAIKYCKLTLM